MKPSHSSRELSKKWLHKKDSSFQTHMLPKEAKKWVKFVDLKEALQVKYPASVLKILQCEKHIFASSRVHTHGWFGFCCLYTSSVRYRHSTWGGTGSSVTDTGRNMCYKGWMCNAAAVCHNPTKALECNMLPSPFLDTKELSMRCKTAGSNQVLGNKDKYRVLMTIYVSIVRMNYRNAFAFNFRDTVQLLIPPV